MNPNPTLINLEDFTSNASEFAVNPAPCRCSEYSLSLIHERQDETDMMILIVDDEPFANIIMVTGNSGYALDAFKVYASDYVTKPFSVDDIKRAILNLRYPIRKDNKGLFVQCFGNFEVYYDGRPLRFKRSKSKEMFAYLIDRRGASVTNRELRAILWQDETSDDEKQSNYFTQIVYNLRKTLEEADAEAMSVFRGEYMGQYDWAIYNYAAVMEE